MKKKLKELRYYFFFISVFSIFISILISRIYIGETLFSNMFWLDFASYAAIWNLILYLLGFFNINSFAKTRFFIKTACLTTSITFLTTMAIHLIETGSLGNWNIALIKNTLILFTLFVLAGIMGLGINRIKNSGVVIVGGGFTGRSVAREIYRSKLLRLDLKGFFSNTEKNDMIIYDGDEVMENHDVTVGTVNYLGTEKMLSGEISNRNIQYLIVAKDTRISNKLMYSLNQLKQSGVKIYYVDEMFEMLTGRLPVRHLEKDYFYYIFREIEKKEEEFSLYAILNRLFNFFASFTALMILVPFMLVFALIIKLESRGPVFFRQTRIGKNGKPFTLYKFRSMRTHDPDKYSRYSCKNDTRITTFGKFMRKMRIDELPQFLNIVKGDMNIVGPRAEWNLLVEEYSKEIPFYHQRHIVRPGLTGWAQVNYSYGANSTDALYKLQYDLYYVKNRSLRLDLIIMFKTIFIMFSLKGI